MPFYSRRTMLATLTGVGLTGCLTRSDSESPGEDGEPTLREIEARLPDECANSLDLDVQWPQELDTDTVGEFVMDYEEAYLVEKNTDHRFESYSFSAELDQSPNTRADGFQVTVTSSGAGTITDYIEMEAFKLGPDGVPKNGRKINLDEDEVPENPEYISVDEIEDQILRAVLQLAADSGYERHRAAHTTKYEELIEDLPTNASLNDRRMGAYFDVNGTPVLLIISERGGAAADFGQIFAQYYVTEYVVRRTDEENKSPEDGTVVDCRTEAFR